MAPFVKNNVCSCCSCDHYMPGYLDDDRELQRQVVARLFIPPPPPIPIIMWVTEWRRAFWDEEISPWLRGAVERWRCRTVRQRRLLANFRVRNAHLSDSAHFLVPFLPPARFRGRTDVIPSSPRSLAPIWPLPFRIWRYFGLSVMVTEEGRVVSELLFWGVAIWRLNHLEPNRTVIMEIHASRMRCTTTLAFLPGY